MGVEQNNEFDYFEINFISGKRKVLYRKLFDGIENHGLYGLVDKINEKLKKGE